MLALKVSASTGRKIQCGHMKPCKSTSACLASAIDEPRNREVVDERPGSSRYCVVKTQGMEKWKRDWEKKEGQG